MPEIEGLSGDENSSVTTVRDFVDRGVRPVVRELGHDHVNVVR
jgi:hypothetical protein